MTEKQTSISSTVAALLASYGSTASPRASVVFDQLVVTGSGRGIQEAPTVWTAVKSWIQAFNPLTYMRGQPSRTLLHNFKGTLEAGEMLLVIGKPGSGCTTFLKSLSGMQEEYRSTTGVLTYGGRVASPKDSDSVRQTFCAEEDSHLPTLTVSDTLRFAIRATWSVRASRDAIDTATRNAAKCVGLEHVLRTRVGSDRDQGASGGERRRVSLAEAFVTCPDVLCFDNPTNGLDSATALEFVEMMSEYTTQFGNITVMSIYQGSNDMLQHFSKVVVIHSGRQIYYGPITEAQPYFESLGFSCPETMTVTDFLTSMTAEPKLHHPRSGLEDRVPRTALEFEAAFQESRYYTALEKTVSDASQRAPKRAPVRPLYSLPLYLQIFECAKRQSKVLVTDWQAWSVAAGTTVVQSLFLGTLFRNQHHDTGSVFVLASSLFFTVLVPALQSLSEFGNTFEQRGLVLRQKRYRMYRPLGYALGLVTTDVAWKVLAIAYTIPQYFLTGFQRTAGKFFIWFLAAYILHLALSMVFRAIAVFSPSVGVAALPVAIMFNAFVIYTGFYIPPPSMQDWLFWLRYLNPMYYAYETVISNEFANVAYTCNPQDLVPSGGDYDSIANQVCAVAGSVPGMRDVAGAAYIRGQYGFSESNLWRNIGINIAIFAFFAIATGIGMERYRLPAGKLATVFYKNVPYPSDKIRNHQASNLEEHRTEDEPPPATQKWTGRDNLHRIATQRGRSLLWTGITLDLTTGGEKKRLLDNINGFVKPGHLTALMGVSGAGKTTLLNTLAGRVDFGNRTGEIFLDGQVLPKSFRRHMGFVPQQDIHLPTQTVREALRVTARLRRPETVSIAEKDAHVEHVISILEMEDIADALIGTPGAGLNLEQRKRVTIGVELSASPHILFLDEPSSGLDGQSVLNITRLLRKLADSGQTILCTIHQPAAEVIEQFDHLLLLLRGGVTAYDGPLGTKCSTALDYFAKHGRRCVEGKNPAEYLLEVVGAGSRTESRSDWGDIWVRSSERSQQMSELEKTVTDSHRGPVDAWQSQDQRTFATSPQLQMRVIMGRTWLYYWRDPEYFTSKLFMNVANALLNGLSNLNAPDSQAGAYNRVFSVFIAFIVGPPLGLQVEGRFHSLREIFLLREKGSQTYHWAVFVACAILIELPYALVAGLFYWLLWYFPVGLPTAAPRAGYALLMYELFMVFVVSLAQLITAVMPNLTATFAANGFLFMFLYTFTGALIPRPQTPAGWRWFYNVSPVAYLSEGLSTNALEGLSIRCTSAETSVFQPPAGIPCGEYARAFLDTAAGYLLVADATSACEYCAYRNGTSYLSRYEWHFDNRYRDFGIFIGFIAFNFSVVIALTYLIKVRKWRRA